MVAYLLLTPPYGVGTIADLRAICCGISARRPHVEGRQAVDSPVYRCYKYVVIYYLLLLLTTYYYLLLTSRRVDSEHVTSVVL